MSRFTLFFCALSIPLACGGTTDSNDGNDGATNGDDSGDATGGTGGITHSSGGNHTGGVGPGYSAECQAHEATRESISEASECIRQGTHCNYGGAYHSMCENIVIELDPPVHATQGKLVLETDTTGSLPLSDDNFCTETMCALASPAVEYVERLDVQLTPTDAPYLDGGLPFPTTITLTLSDEDSGDTIQSRTVSLDYSCASAGDRWCWMADPLTIDLSVTSLGGGAP